MMLWQKRLGPLTLYACTVPGYGQEGARRELDVRAAIQVGPWVVKTSAVIAR